MNEKNIKYMTENEELYRAWIGTQKQDKIYDKLKKSSFSWLAFIFTDFLFIIRHMFAEAFALIACRYVLYILILSSKIGWKIFLLVEFVIHFICGFKYYDLYRWYIKRKIKQKDLGHEKSIKRAMKKGGNKFTLSVMTMFALKFFNIIFLFVFIFLGHAVSGDEPFEFGYEYSLCRNLFIMEIILVSLMEITY